MGIADPEAALEKLHEFRETLDEYDDDSIHQLVPFIEEIARRVDPDNVSRLAGRLDALGVWHWITAEAETARLIGILEQQADYQRILGPRGPTLAAEGLHRWVWHAAVNLWDGENFKQAVSAAAAAVEAQTQLKLDRGDLSGTDLYTQAFKVDKIGTNGRRLRFPHIEELTSDGKRNQDWTSAHQGAMSFGQGCAQGIRNLNTHGTGELPEHEALEYLASLSVLARWVDTCEVVGA